MEPRMTVRDVMAVTRLSRSKVYQLKDQGLLPALRLPGCHKVLFDPDTVRRYLASGRVESPSTAG
jgi:excisionase family DNA binding protein